MSAVSADAFLQSVAEAAEAGGVPLALIVETMSADRARVLRACAIPHTCEVGLIEAMEPDLPSDFVRSACSTLIDAGLMERVEPLNDDPFAFAVYPSFRDSLMTEWLHGDRASFERINRRASEYLDIMRPKDPYAAERVSRELIFHKIAAEPASGVAELETACARYIQQNQPASARALFAYARELAPILYPDYRHRLSLVEGSVLAANGNLEQARLTFEAALTTGDGADPRVLLHLARIEAREGVLPRAERFYRRSIEAFENGPPSSLPDVAIVRVELGSLLRRSGRLEEAKPMIEQALGGGLLAEDRARAHYELGLLHNAAGEIDLARKDYELGLQALSAEPPSAVEAALSREIALLMERQENWAAAEQGFRSSLTLLERLGDTMAVAQVLSDLARLSWRQKQLPVAAKLAGEAGDAYLRVRANAHAGLAHLQAGRVLTELQEKSAARQAYETAEGLLDRSGAGELLAVVRKELSDLTRTRRLIAWFLSGLGLTGLAGLVGLAEVEHLYLGIASMAFLASRLASGAWDVIQSIGADVEAWPVSRVIVVLLVALVGPATFIAAAERERKRQSDRLLQYSKLFGSLPGASRNEIELCRREISSGKARLSDPRSWQAAFGFIAVSLLGFGLFADPSGGVLGTAFSTALQTDPADFLQTSFLRGTFAGAYLAVVLRYFSALEHNAFDETAFYAGTIDLLGSIAIGVIAGVAPAVFGNDLADFHGAAGVLLIVGFICGMLSAYSRSRSEDPLTMRVDEQFSRLHGLDERTKRQLIYLGFSKVATLASANPILLSIKTGLSLDWALDLIGQAQLAALFPSWSTATGSAKAPGVRTSYDLVRYLETKAGSPDLMVFDPNGELMQTVTANPLVQRHVAMVTAAAGIGAAKKIPSTVGDATY